MSRTSVRSDLAALSFGIRHLHNLFCSWLQFFRIFETKKEADAAGRLLHQLQRLNMMHKQRMVCGPPRTCNSATCSLFCKACSQQDSFGKSARMCETWDILRATEATDLGRSQGRHASRSRCGSGSSGCAHLQEHDARRSHRAGAPRLVLLGYNRGALGLAQDVPSSSACSWKLHRCIGEFSWTARANASS